MVSLTCAATERDGVTLVTARLAGGPRPRRVRLDNRLDGPLWPPRRRGVPAAGWADDGYECVVPAGETVALGYASPAPAADPPLELVEDDPVSGEPEDGAPASPAAAAVRELGDPTPPRDAIPRPSDGEDDGTSPGTPEARAGAATLPADVPDEVAAWLSDVADRARAAERLAAAETLPEATAAVGDVGGLAAVESLVDAVEADARALEAVTARTRDLADRAAGTDVPLETLERIA